ncbi:MAG: hypothetical protein U0930_16450 [Pirellulales bacterium]
MTEIRSHTHSNSLHIKTFEQTLAEVQNYYLILSPSEEIWSEELLAQRRYEAERE